MASIKIRDLYKSFEKNTNVLKKISLDVRNGEFLVLVGPSGCGKSTLLRIIAGLEELTSGEVFIGDNRVNDLPAKKRNIAMVFQNYALYPHMNVFQNLAFGLKLRKTDKNQIEKTVRKTAEILEITDLLKRKPKELSGGQRQRVALGRAIVRDPQVFLFDEPLSNLDAKLRIQMRAEIKKLHKRLGTTMIYVTHDQVEAMTMGDRIVVIRDGIIQQVDNPANVYAVPSNKFVAGFIGSPPMNFIEGTIRNDEIIWGKHTIKTDQSELTKKLNGQQCIIGIRPGDIKLVNKGIELPVLVVESFGDEIHIHLEADPEPIVARLSALAAENINDTVNIAFNIEKIHLFDIKSGERMTI